MRNYSKTYLKHLPSWVNCFWKIYFYKLLINTYPTIFLQCKKIFVKFCVYILHVSMVHYVSWFKVHQMAYWKLYFPKNFRLKLKYDLLCAFCWNIVDSMNDQFTSDSRYNILKYWILWISLSSSDMNLVYPNLNKFENSFNCVLDNLLSVIQFN